MGLWLRSTLVFDVYIVHEAGWLTLVTDVGSTLVARV